MNRQRIQVEVSNTNYLAALAHLANRMQYAALLDSGNFNGSQLPVHYTSVDCLAAFGAMDVLQPKAKAFQELETFLAKNKDFAFGHFSYDLKNQLEQLQSENSDEVLFPDLVFFQPEIVVKVKDGMAEIYFHEGSQSTRLMEDVHSCLRDSMNTIVADLPALDVKSRLSKVQYQQAFGSIQEELYQGNIYEVNFCQEFYVDSIELDAAQAFNELRKVASSPFSAFYKLPDHTVMCSSPERFLAKKGKLLVSQPIKGTAKRSANPLQDEALKTELQQSRKNQKENVMIVDLVRNDLSKVAERQSVVVRELFGVYAFPQVYQMISTVEAQLKESTAPVQAIAAAFPMGSMTGAPKVSAMNIIEQLEQTKRGIYSGSIGYFEPNGDFDFNVVIRSIVYNSSRKYLSYMVGGAITHLSNWEEEYEECLLKASPFFKTFRHQI